MISYQSLTQKPRVFKSGTGLDRDEFDRLFQKFLPVWVTHERERLDRPKRAIGGGRPYKLLLQDRNVSRNCHRQLQVLRALGDETPGRPDLPKRGEGKSVEEALRECPELPAIVDTTEQRIRRPGDDERQRQHYEGAYPQDRDRGQRVRAGPRSHALDARLQARFETRGRSESHRPVAARGDLHGRRGL